MPSTRRDFARSAGLGVLAPPAALAQGRDLKKPMNVLFLLSDQHKPGALGINGDPYARTPALDSLAKTSVRFRNAYCTNPICGPARASLWTGLHTHNHRVLANEMPWPVEQKSVADSFRRAGYNTAAIGKMHFADAGTHGFDYRLDFNDWYQYLGPKAKIYADEVGTAFPGDGHPQLRSLWPEGDPWTYTPDGRKGRTHPGRASLLPENDHFESFVARETIAYLKRYAAHGPFFLVSSYLKPHQPFMPAERFARMYKAEDMRLPATWGRVDLEKSPRFIRQRITTNPLTPELLDPKLAPQRIASYYGCLAQMDDCIGQVLRAVEEAGLAGNTIIVYTSDHGELLGEHGLWQKFVFYESSVGVPLTIRVPGMTAADAVCHTPVSHTQLAPTLMELCGVDALARTDGKSFAALLKQPELPQQNTIFAEYDMGTKAKKFMIRDGDWKYCHYHGDTPELFHLKNDPDEMKNLAFDREYESRMNELAGKLFDWHAPAKA